MDTMGYAFSKIRCYRGPGFIWHLFRMGTLTGRIDTTTGGELLSKHKRWETHYTNHGVYITCVLETIGPKKIENFFSNLKTWKTNAICQYTHLRLYKSSMPIETVLYSSGGNDRVETKYEENNLGVECGSLLLRDPISDVIDDAGPEKEQPIKPQTQSIKTKIQVKTHRFTFSNGCTEKLTEFAHRHETDDRKVFQRAWAEWIQTPDIKTMIEEEIQTLMVAGFDGDVLDKMFKSTRYYYRKKPVKDGPKEQKPRKKYERLDSEILEEMDQHIMSEIKENTVLQRRSVEQEALLSIQASPSVSFEKYCILHKDNFLEEARLEFPDQDITKDQLTCIVDKFKKTYKNRFYVMRQALIH